MENKKSFFRVLFTFVIFLLMTGQRALAVNGWNIQTSTSDDITTFTVTRTNKTEAETVKYRLVNLSAYAGQHYKVIQVNGNVISESQQSAALSGEFTFAAGDDTRTIQVMEQGANTKAYMYQTGSNRSYKLEVTDAGGFLLFDKTRSFATGKDVNISRAFQEQSVTICSNEVTVTDAGYAQSSNPHTVASSSYFDENTQAYLGFLNAQLRMTLDFQAKEKSDGYQYVQILVNNTSDCDTGAGSGDPGTISLSRYMAGFDIGGSAVNTYYSYSFPVTSAGNNEGASKPWAGIGNSVTDLKKQKFNTGCRATDGKLIIPTNFSTLVVRLNASGSDNDDWYVKNIKAKITAVDEAAPYKLNISVAPGMHAHGNTVYVSVAFNEIVTVSGTPKLITTTANNWGNLSYVAGSGSNVLTFSGKIGDNATGTLNITGFDGTITDLAGNPLSSNALNQSGLCSLSNSYNYPITYDLAGGSVATQNPSSYTYDTNSFTLTNPTRLGYTFAGWTGTDLDAATQNVSIDQHTHVSRNYTANWTINTYKITCDYAWGGREPFSLQYTVESGTIIINGHYRNGYFFAGWTGDSLDGATMTVIIPTGSVGDRNYIAHWIDVWGMEDGATGYEDHPYIITSTQGLDLLAESVNRGDNYADSFFQLGCDITYSYTTNWNDAGSNENNFTPIGGNNGNRYFRGIFDGMGHTISGIRIYNGDSNISRQGLFGATSGATIRNVILADARITGKMEVGGIVGYNKDGVVENCRVDSNVDIHSVAFNSDYHGGVVGSSNNGDICGCVSSATLSVADGLSSIDNYGGIVGRLDGDMTDCLALGVSVPAVGNNGAISGYVAESDGNRTDNYFYDCTVGANAHKSDAYTVSAGTDVTVTPADSADQSYPYDGIKRYGAALYYDGVLYAPAAADVSLALGYTGTPEIGYTLNEYVTNAGTISGTDSPYILSMPSQDVTVGATTIDVWDVEKGNDGSTADKAYTITSTAGLDLLAKLVNGGNDFSGKFFKSGCDITYTYSNTDNENNYTSIGGYIDGNLRSFSGTFDGMGHTISGIRIFKGGDDFSDNCQGLFGATSGATIRNIILSDARITGYQEVGGIVGYNKGTVENCRVGSDVIIHAVTDYAYSHGGVAGSCNGGTIRGCVSSATISLADNCLNFFSFGGIVGELNGNMFDCLAMGVNISVVNSYNALVGYVAGEGYTYNFNYFHDCIVGTDSHQSDAYTVSAGTDVTVAPADRADQSYPYDGIKRCGSALYYDGVLYAPSATEVSLALGYTGTPEIGYAFDEYVANAGTFSGANSLYTLTMPSQDVTVGANIIDAWDVEKGNDGSTADKSYTITTTAGLNLMAKLVNDGNNFSGKFFKLDNDIDMNGVSFDGIGSFYNYFMGTFDGDGHTISNVTIDRSNGSDVVGFFGHISEGTVKNLIIDGASITGKNYVGGIIGYSYKTTVSNCLVLNTSITVTTGDKCGVYGYSGGSLTLTNNHYNNCTVTIGETTYTTNIGVSSNDLDGVRSVYALTLPEHVTASSSDTVTIGTTTYYASDVQVTLSHDQGYKITDVKVDDISATSSDEGFNWIVTMPAADATVTCRYSVPYIDADGVEQYCTNYTLVQNSDTCVHYGSYAKENWYVVDGDVFISDPSNNAIFLIDSISHIIICDDATLVAIGNGWGEAICNFSGEIRIYGQTLGNGFIYAIGNAGSPAIFAYEGININGGNIFAQANNYGINSENNIIINRGTVKASGIKGDTVTINGGKVHTIDYNYGICGERYISLGWKSVDDRIFANNYITTLQNSSVIIKDTQAFADSLGNCYTGTLNQQDQLAIAGRTLQPCCIIALPEHVVATGVISQDGITAYALPGSVITLRARMGCKMSGVAFTGVTATDNGDETYTFTMPAQKVTVSATVTDLWGIGAGKDGSTADKAYTITTTAGLDLLATLVNDGNDYNGKYFKLGGNIEYDSSIENNYTAIGTDSNPFEGIFDGNGYTVSGINIQSNESYQGLFGMIIIGEVRNLTVKGADIRGNNNVGAIAGKCEGSLENCLVIETTVSGNNDVDMICGGYGYWSLHLANCHYINCRRHNWSPGYYSTDLYTVNAGNDVLMSINSYDKGFEYNGVLYFPTEAEVILDLSYTGQVPDGDVPIFVTTEGILSKTANSYLLVVSDNETINALIGKPDINYIDSIGVAQVCPAAVPITSHEGDLEYEYGGWFVVNGQVTVNGMISFDEDAHIILCDGATLTADAIISEYYGISIYAQSSGDDMGCINSGIYVNEELTINGGKITTKKTPIEEFKGIGIYADNMTMYSGIINTMGDSIVCDYLVLGWRNTTDCVTAGGYRCDYFEIYPGQVLTDGNYLYYGLMNLTQIDEMSGKTLMPYQTYAVTESDGITDAIAADIAGEMVSFGRNYIEDIATTICLPFSISDVSVGDLYKFVDVTYSNRDGWVATMEELETDYDGFLVTPTEAGKPYLFRPYSTGTWSFVGRVPDDVSSVAGATTSGDWTFHGTYSRMNYGDEGFSGTVFGFAATDGKAADGVTDVEAGQFVKAASGAYILPFRAYLTYSGSNNALRAPGRDGAGTPAIPNRIKVRLVRSNGLTTAIGTMDMETGEVTIDQWFYLNGQPVEGAPTAPGMYLNADGKKVMITE